MTEFHLFKHIKKLKNLFCSQKTCFSWFFSVFHGFFKELDFKELNFKELDLKELDFKELDIH